MQIPELIAAPVRSAIGVAADTHLAIGRVIAKGYVWSILGTSWTDHRVDYLRGPKNWFWQERGILGCREIKLGDEVLDLSCGDGFFSKYYYAYKAGRVDAIDRDRRAIAIARRGAPGNVSFFVQDASSPFPSREYDVVLWFAAIEHLTAPDGLTILQKISDVIGPRNGLLFGSTDIHPHSPLSNFEHKNEFQSEGQLEEFLAQVFPSITLWQSPWPTDRQEWYFWCRARN